MTWRAQGLSKQEKSRLKDLEHDIDTALGVPPRLPRGGRKKNGKKWCRGKVGREHTFVKHRESKFFNRSYVVMKCSVCGKEKWEQTG